MEGDRTLVDLTGGNVSDVPISFPEPPENRLQVQSSAADEDEKGTGNVSDDRIGALHLEIETLRLERSDLQRMLASLTADYEDKLSRMQQVLIVESSKAENARVEADMTKTALENQKNDLEDRARHLEGLISDIKKAKESEAANFLKKEDELRLVVEELDFKAEKARVALMQKEEEVNALTEALNKCKEEVEAEKEKTRYSVAKEKEVVTSLEEKLAAERQNARLAMEKKEEVISSLTEELRIEREKGRDVLGLEKNFVDAMAEKESEIVSLKKDLLLAKENQETGKEEELKQLKDDVSKLEGQIKKSLSGDEDGGFLQNNRGMEPKKVEDGLKFSWVTTAAIMASTGTAAAAITAFCLRDKKQG